MNPKKIWANLAVTDPERTAKFYTALGFKPNGVKQKTSPVFSLVIMIYHPFFCEGEASVKYGRRTC